mgnify:CR=1 FL=1
MLLHVDISKYMYTCDNTTQFLLHCMLSTRWSKLNTCITTSLEACLVKFKKASVYNKTKRDLQKHSFCVSLRLILVFLIYEKYKYKVAIIREIMIFICLYCPNMASNTFKVLSANWLSMYHETVWIHWHKALQLVDYIEIK